MPGAIDGCATFMEPILGRSRGRRGPEAARLALPMPGFHAPAIALPDPLMRDPVPSGVWRRPKPGHPFVAVANPAPISIQPHVAGRGRDADDFFSRLRGGHHHHAASVVPLVRYDDT